MKSLLGLALLGLALVGCGSEGTAMLPCPTIPDAGRDAAPVMECHSGETRPCVSYCEATSSVSLHGEEVCVDGRWSGTCRPTAEEQSRCIPVDTSPSHMTVDLDDRVDIYRIVLASDPTDAVDHPSLVLFVLNDGGAGILDEVEFQATVMMMQGDIITHLDFSMVVTSCGLYQGDTQVARAFADSHGLRFRNLGLRVADRSRPATQIQLRCDYHPIAAIGFRRGGWIEVRIGAPYDGFHTRESSGWVQGTLVLQQASSPVSKDMITVITNDR